MKTNITIITLLLLTLIVPLILTGCGNDQPNNNDAAYQPTLSELILRHLEGRTITDTDKEPLKGSHKKQGLRDNTKKDNTGKKHLKGFDKHDRGWQGKQGLKDLLGKRGLKGLDKKQGQKGLPSKRGLNERHY